MKLNLILVTICLVAISTATPIDEWVMIPDGNGHMRMVSMTEVDNNVPETRFDPASDTNYVVYSQANRAGVTVPLNNAAALAASGFNVNHPTRFTIHGWNSNANALVNTGTLSGLTGGFNIIVVDWSAGANTLNYITARNRVDHVGLHLGTYINWLNSLGVQFINVNIIGHSLGAHTAGMAGKNTNGLVNTILALDPAGPLFSVADINRRVASHDAHYVEVIHTNGNLLGFGDPIGDADFYPNGGNSQPGCGIDLAGTCAHSRANEFWSESLLNHNFWATPCTTWAGISGGNCVQAGPHARMGGEPSNQGQGVSGVFFLTTAGSAPFAHGPRSAISHLIDHE